MYKIIDNFLPKYYLGEIVNHFTNYNCLWHYNNSISMDTVNCLENLNSYGLSMSLYSYDGLGGSYESALTLALMLATLEEVENFNDNAQKLVRARADMTLYNPSEYQHEVHTDYVDLEHTTAIFYATTSDGNTLIYDKNKENLIVEIEPISNRLVIFDGLLPHTGHSPSKHKNRLLFNMNFVDPIYEKTMKEKYYGQ